MFEASGTYSTFGEYFSVGSETLPSPRVTQCLARPLTFARISSDDEDYFDLILGMRAMEEPGGAPWEEVKKRLGL